MALTNGIKLAPLLVEMKADIKGFKDDMSKASVAGVSEAKKISKELSNVTKVGENLSKTGSNLTKFVSLPLAGVGVAAGKMAIDFESSFAKVSTLLDANVVDFDKYKQDLLKASSDSKIAVGEFSEAVYGSISAGVDQTKAIEFTTNAMKLAKGGFTEGAKAVDVLTTAINGYGLTTEDTTKISDMLITTQNLGKTTVDELASSMGAVIPVASSVNFSIDELNASYAQLTKNGIATAESGTYLKSMLSELGKSGSITDKTLRELTGKGFADLKKEGKSTTEILSMINDEAKKNDKSLKDMFGSVEAGSAALVLMKSDGKEYNEMLKAMETSAGATQDAFNKMDATPAEQLKGVLNKLKNESIELGIKLIPTITKITDGIGKLVDKFSNLSEEQQDNILKWGGIAIAAGPVLKLLGGGITTFSKVGSAVGSVSKALGIFKIGASAAATATAGVTTAAGTAAGATGLGGLAAGLGGAVVAAAPFVLATAGVAAAGYGVYKVMTNEVVPSVDLFADTMVASGTKMTEYGEVVTYETVKISEATKEAVQAYLDMDNGVTNTLDSLYINSTAITEDTCNNLMAKYREMGNTITVGLEEDKNRDLEILNEFFASSTSLSELEKQRILEDTNQLYNTKEEVIKDKTEGIKQLLERASNENRQLTQEEMKSINEIQQEMKTQAIKTLSANEIEAKAILERMSASDKRITAEQAGEHIKTLNNSRDEAIRIANEEYDGTVKAIIRMRDESGTITAQQADKMIKEAERQRDGIVKNAEDTRYNALEKMRELNKNLDDEVDTSSGDILNTWDKLKRWWSGWKPESKSFTYSTTARKEQMSDGYHYNGLSYVPFDGYSAILHKGERVLTAEENREYIQNDSKSSEVNQTFVFNGKVESPYEVAKATKKSMRDLQFA